MRTRTAILNELRACGTWITGAAMGEALGVSRAAVSAHVRALRRAGYDIEAVRSRGYRFRAASEQLIAAEVHRLSKCQTMGQSTFVHHMSIHSTNASARELAEQGCPEGTLVVAEEQTEGKGRKGRDWASPPGTGIYATLALRPRLPLEDTPLLTLLSAVAAAEAIRAITTLRASIKWPNDILINGRKVAGILTEVSSDVDQVEFALIGMGLNVNTPAEDLPDRPIFPATSLAIEAGAPQPRAALLAKWLDLFEAEYTLLLQGKRHRLLERWKELANITGKHATIKRVHDSVSGTIEDIDADGALLLRTPDGTCVRILSGDVKFDD